MKKIAFLGVMAALTALVAVPAMAFNSPSLIDAQVNFAGIKSYSNAVSDTGGNLQVNRASLLCSPGGEAEVELDDSDMSTGNAEAVVIKSIRANRLGVDDAPEYGLQLKANVALVKSSTTAYAFTGNNVQRNVARVFNSAGGEAEVEGDGSMTTGDAVSGIDEEIVVNYMESGFND